LVFPNLPLPPLIKEGYILLFEIGIRYDLVSEKAKASELALLLTLSNQEIAFFIYPLGNVIEKSFFGLL